MVVATGRQYRTLILALIASLLLWHLPFGGVVLYPFKLFATWIHELSHGLVMLLSGAGFDRMEIYRDTSGFAYSVRPPGPVAMAFVASAGYVGTAVFGGALLVIGRTHRGERRALIALGLALALSAALFVRNGFGVAAVLIGAASLFAIAVVARGAFAGFLLNFIAAQSCINAVLDIRVLFRSNLVVNGEVMARSDAHNMATATFGTYWMWAGAWLAWSFFMFYLALRISHHRARKAAEANTPAPQFVQA